MENIKKIMYSYKEQPRCIIINAISGGKCQRCGALVSGNECENCAELGVLTIHSKLYLCDEKITKIYYNGNFPSINLTSKQKEASSFLLNSLSDSLIWAVCGAGKTEIIFEAIYKEITKGFLVCFCCPRVDIVYEIYERLKFNFENIKISLLTGSEKIIEEGNLYVMTTNQILKFYKCFSLIIVDEVDAFPFAHNSKFDYGVNNAKLATGKIIYMTSTPSDFIKEKKLNTFIISRRWHGFDLPVPKLIFYKFDPYKLNIIMKYYIRHSKKQKLIFISNIKKIKIFYKTLKKHKINCAYVYSGLENRQDTINSFRNKEIDVLISTTILERGVTFDDIDVIVMDSDNSHYNEAALIQIAGRVNRKIEFQNGKVYFLHSGITKNMKKAIKNIRFMNKQKD